ncbi:protein NLRC5-like isoform X1 [Acipenser ruthenus]|uniref:protein NLRC5-like isoform X1 n=1 Tax=Acipenser ruthenus TaxID=7906 RepID=UPI002741E97E|nr:protein NLRC5-like isoform X1 [Acipenser ruthenus]XP_058849875.1 protein NLRC5-like isoform X1 [Acipenser ruthenus]
MDEVDLYSELGAVRSQLVDVLSLEAAGVLQQLCSLLNAEEQEEVNRTADRKGRVSLIVDLFRDKNPGTCRQFIQTVCMICNELPMQLETRLMSAAGDGNPSEISPTEYPSCAPDDPSHSFQENPRRRPATESVLATETKYPRIDFAERYKSLMMKMLLLRYEKIPEDPLKRVTLDKTFISVVKKNVTKLRERIDRTRDEPCVSQDSEDGTDTMVKISDLLEPSTTSDSRVIVLLGKAGTGKTMLMHNICHQWAKGTFAQFQYTFLFEFRQLNLVKRKLTLRQLLFNFFLLPEEEQDAVFEFISANPRGVCLIFDGYDEFLGKFSPARPDICRDPLKPFSVAELFSGLYTGSILNGCTLLVTCRPKDVLDLPLSSVDRVGEVLGFDHRRVEEYALHFFRDSGYKQQAVAHLMENRNILNMCYVPALCFISCVCLDDLLSTGSSRPLLPSTMTQFYTNMLTAFLRKKDAVSSSVATEPLLLQKYRQEINGLCQLAMKGLEKSNIVFYTRDVPESVMRFASNNGFLTAFEVKKEDGTKDLGCAFAHLTMQEFFAALHLITSDSVTEAQLKKKFNLKSKWISRNDPKSVFTDTFHIFVSGLSSRECTQFLSRLARRHLPWVEKRQKVILEILKKLAASNLTGPKIIELCHCTFEIQDLELAKLIGASLRYELRNFRLTPVDMTALVFVMNTGVVSVCLDLAGCSMERDCLEVLPNCKTIHTLIFRSRKYDDRFAEALSVVLPKIRFLKKFEFIGGHITELGATKLAIAIQHCHHLEEINFNDNFLTDVGISEIANSFPKMKTLCKMTLGNNAATVDGILSLVKTMSTCSSIEKIHVVGTKTAEVIFSRGSGNLPDSSAGEATRCSLNRKLSLVKCSITSQHVGQLCEILQRCPGLSEVDLSGNYLQDEGCKALIDCLPKLNISKQIILSNNHVSEEGLCSLSHSLNVCPNVVEVEGRHKSPKTAVIRFAGSSTGGTSDSEAKGGDSGGNTLKQNLKVSKKLRLTSCNIQPRHLEKLFQTVKLCSDLEELDLSDNALGDRGLARLIKHLPGLQGVRVINVSNNLVTMDSILCLAGSLCTCKNICEVDMSSGGGKNLFIKFHRSPVSEAPGTCSEEHENGQGFSKRFSLRESDIHARNMDRLCRRLTQCEGLAELDFSDSVLDDKSIEKLLSHLPQLQPLKLLNISNSRISTDGALLLVQSLLHCERVRAVELRPKGEAFIKFVKMKADQATCKLNEYNLDKKNIEKLSGILEQCSHLSEVDLSSNLLKDEGVKCFLDFLPRLQISNAVNLNNNKLSQVGVLYLVDSMSICNRVVEVEVCLGTEEKSLIRFMQGEERSGSVRSILQGDCASVSERVKAGPCAAVPRHISLKECSFGPEHLVKLAAILERSPNLVTLDLSYNTLQKEGLPALQNALANLKSLRSLQIRNNGMTFEAVVNLVRELNGCPDVLTVRIEEPWIQSEGAVCLVFTCIQLNSNILEIRVHKNTVHITMENPNLPTTGNMDSAANRDLGSRASVYAGCHVRSISLINCGLQDHNLPLLASLGIHCLQLQELDLSHSSIGSMGAVTLSQILPSLGRLKKLSLESTQATAHEMVQLAAGLSRCLSIESLNLSHNKIGDAGATAVADILPGMSRLRQINISRCSAVSSTGGLVLVQALCKCTSLEEINLDALPLDPWGITCLAEALSSMKSAKKLILSEVNTSVEGGVYLVDSLKGCTRIEEIDLGNNRIGDKGALKLVQHIPGWKNLRKISLSQNSIGDAGGKKLADALSNCRLIEEICLANNSIGDEAAVKLADVLPIMTHLKVLSLQANRITPYGGSKLAQMLPTCKQLEEISLSENTIGREGAFHLADALPRMKSLKTLDLKLINISDSDSIHLAVSLGHCPTIEEVNLSWNYIGDDAALKIAEILPRMKRLKELDLECNKITELGAKKLAERLWNCPAVKVLRLWKNQIPKEIAQALQDKDSRLNFSSV